MSQVTDTERARMHAQTAAIANTLNTNPSQPMSENTLISQADRATDNTRERTYLLASLPPATGMTQGEYAAGLRGATR